MDDKLNFFGGDVPAEAETVHEAPIAETPAPEAQEPPSQPRGSDGKFQPKEADPAPDASPKQPPLSDKELGGTLKALLDTRDRAQAAERERDALKSQIAAQQAKIEAQANPPSVEAQLEARLYAQNLTMSRRFAEREYGKDEVAKVHDWAASQCDADPVFNAKMRSSDHPYEDAIQAWKREQVASKVTPERLAAFEAWEAAQSGASSSNPSPPQPAPPRSLATASGTGAAGASHVPTHPGSAFEAVIK